MLLSKRSRNERREFENSYQQEEAAKTAETARQAAEQAAQLRAQSRAALFAAPSPELQAKCTPYEGNHSAAEVEQLVGRAFSAARFALADKGITLTTSGTIKLGDVLRLNGRAIDSTDTKNLQTVIEYMIFIDAFEPDDIVRRETQKPAAPAQPTGERTAEVIEADIDALRNDRSAEGRRCTQELRIELIGLETQESGIFGQFCAFIREQYQVPFGHADKADLKRFLHANDLLMTPANLNRYRVSRGWLTADEKLGMQIENDSRPSTDYSFQRDAKLAQHALRK